MTRRSPLSTFLPGVEPGDGLFALLGLDPTRCDASSIDAALRQRLRAIDAHPHANAPEADEVRATLHAAAAHLHHPSIRAEAIARYTSFAPNDPQTHPSRPIPAPTPAQPPLTRAVPLATLPSGPIRLPPEEEAYRDLVIRVLVHAGGWNETAKRRLAAVTHQHGRPLRHLQAALRLIALTGPARRYRPTLHASASEPIDRHQPDLTLAPVAAPPGATRQRRILLIASVLFTLNSIVLLIVFAGILRERMAWRTAHAAPTQSIGADSDTTERLSGARVRDRLFDQQTPEDNPPIARLASLRAATAAMSAGDPPQLSAFARHAEAIANQWTTIDAPALQALMTSMAEFVTAASRTDPTSAMLAIDAIAGPSDPIARLSASPRADQLAPAAFSVAMLVRLQRDRDLTPGIHAALQRRIAPFERLADRLPPAGNRTGSFDAGLHLALRALIARLNPAQDPPEPAANTELWRRWHSIAEALHKRSPTLAQLVRIDTLEHLLLNHRLIHTSPEAARLITNSIDWLDPVAARRLLRWNDSSEFAPHDLNTLLSWIADSLPDRITSDLLTPASASAAERVAARDRLALALGVAVRPAGEFDRDLIARGVALIEEAGSLPTRTSGTEELTIAAALALFNEAAARRATQDRAGAEAALARASTGAINDELLQRSPNAGSRPLDLAALTAPATGDDGRWGLRAIQSHRDRDTLAGLMNQLANLPRTLGPADAGVLVEIALTNSSTPIRDAALRAVRRHAHEPALFEALLQFAALRRRGLDRVMGEMVLAITGRDLPIWNDPRFPLEARRALLARHIALITAARTPSIDDLASIIAHAYTQQIHAARVGAGLRPIASLPAASGAPTPLPAADLADTYQTIASFTAATGWNGASLADTNTRRRARAARAEGQVQLFHTEQLAAAELLAHIVLAEQPSLASEVDGVMESLADRRRAAGSITRQIVATESAIAELWIMRLGYHETRRLQSSPAHERAATSQPASPPVPAPAEKPPALPTGSFTPRFTHSYQ